MRGQCPPKNHRSGVLRSERHSYGIGFQIKSAPGAGPRQMRGIDAFIDLQAVTNWGSFVPYVMWAWDQTPAVKPTTSDVWDDITLDGYLKNMPAGRDFFAAPSHPTTSGARIWLGPGLAGGFYPPTYKPYLIL